MPSSPAMVTPSSRRAVALWLAACLALIACMVLVGGYTRLSGSGLSITQWKLLHGVIPPLNDGAWEEEFTAYRATPQYTQVNAGMTVDAFKTIFWPEYWHRVLGRAIGVVFLLPLAWFRLRRDISARFALRLLGIFALGGLQGAVGWIMVQSGLVNDPHVSHFRLAAHLVLAFLIFGLILWAWLDVVCPHPALPPSPRLRRTGRATLSPRERVRVRALWAIFFLLCLQIVYGALMAGTRAGLVYNSFPTMNGAWVPPGLWALSPWWRNLLENVETIQFIHRWLAIILGAAMLLGWLAWRRTAQGPLKALLAGVAATVVVQIGLGALTLVRQIPLELALMHQFTALLLFGLMLASLHRMRERYVPPATLSTESD